jgi:hypothetical protein
LFSLPFSKLDVNVVCRLHHLLRIHFTRGPFRLLVSTLQRLVAVVSRSLAAIAYVTRKLNRFYNFRLYSVMVFPFFFVCRQHTAYRDFAACLCSLLVLHNFNQCLSPLSPIYFSVSITLVIDLWRSMVWFLPDLNAEYHHCVSRF